MNSKEQTSYTSDLLDTLRGVAAFLVVLGHSREHAAKIFELSPLGSSLIETILLVPASFAMESVAVFFVLSGFLVGGQTISTNKNNVFHWKTFLIKRLSRLWTVLIPGILFTWLIFQILKLTISTTYSAPSLFEATCNILFLQEFHCKSYSINHSLWSLSYEFWFYIIFAILVKLALSLNNKEFAKPLFYSTVLLLILWLLEIKLLYLFPAWLLGSLLYNVPELKNEKLKLNLNLILLFSVILLTMTAILSNYLRLSREHLTLLVSLPTLLFIYVSIHTFFVPRWLRKALSYTAKLGTFSFSMYVFHLPFVIFLIHLIKNFISDVIYLPIIVYSISIITIPFTYILWFIFERNTSYVREFMLRAR